MRKESDRDDRIFVPDDAKSDDGRGSNDIRGTGIKESDGVSTMFEVDDGTVAAVIVLSMASIME